MGHVKKPMMAFSSVLWYWLQCVRSGLSGCPLSPSLISHPNVIPVSRVLLSHLPYGRR